MSSVAQEDLYIALAPGIDVVGVDEERLLLKSDLVSLTLDGAAATFFRQRVIPLLDGSRRLSQLVSMLPEVAPEALAARLDELNRARVLCTASTPIATKSGARLEDPFHALLEGLGIPVPTRIRRLQSLHVVVFGLEAHGAWVADCLARLGIGRLTLVDPFAADQVSWRLLPHAEAAAVGVPRQTWLRTKLAELDSPTDIRVAPEEPLNKAGVVSQAADAQFLVGCFDRAFSAVHHWINGASFELRIPAVYSEIRGHRLVAGPMVFPHETPCYLCWRMRSVACADDFAEQMAYEEHLDRLRRPAAAARPALPTLFPYAAALVVTEIIKSVFGVGLPALTGKTLEFDALEGRTTTHPIVFRPDCPVCKKKRTQPPQPTLIELSSARGLSTGLEKAVERLVSQRCGIIRTLKPVLKDPSEPQVPYVYRAELANHRFLKTGQDAFVVCSGKGLTTEEALRGALGEAIERYSGAAWADEYVVHRRSGELEGEYLDPTRLVLFHPDQYRNLPYAPFVCDTPLGWIQGTSLRRGRPIWVPAIGVFMAYDLKRPEENLFPISSNGLAAGATLLDAVVAAALEVIERDAFLTTWLHRLPCRRVDIATLPDPAIRSVIDAYSRRRVAFELYELPTEGPATAFIALGLSNRSDEPAVVVGLGADLEPCRAARSAILEVAQVRPALRIKMREPKTRDRMEQLVTDPTQVTSLQDHDLLYAHPSRSVAFEFLRSAAVESYDWRVGRVWAAPEKLGTLVQGLSDIGSDLVYVNLTPPEFADSGPFTARAILPDFQPIHFGYREARLGGDRLFQLPAKLGLRTGRASLSGLNPDPHPLA